MDNIATLFWIHNTMVRQKMTQLVIYLFAMTSCINQEKGGVNADSLNILRQLCPYNNFCQSQATKIINNTKHSPCCRPCSCDEDCEQLQSCCPDKEIQIGDLAKAFDSEELSCKRSEVGWIHGNDDLVVRHRHPYYLIIDHCPFEESDTELKRKCNSTDTSTFERFLWVSDKANGKIFQNKFCATCHGVREFVYWKIGIQECNILPNDSLPIESILQSNNCYLIREKPADLHVLTSKYRCFVPDVSRCNETGTWAQYNATIDMGCNAYDMPFITETPSMAILSVYRNIFCYLCNTPVSHRGTDICQTGNTKTVPISSFIGIIDYNRLIKETKYDSKCRFDQIFDHILDACHQVYCQPGWIPSGDVCLRNPYVNPASSIRVTYKLQLQLPATTELMGETYTDLVRNITRTNALNILSRTMDYETVGCKPCLQELFSLNESTGNFYLSNQVRTTSQCDLETLLVHMIYFLDTNVTVDKDLRISFHFESLVKGNFAYIPGNHTLIGFEAQPFFCGSMQKLTSILFCPRLLLDYSCIARLPIGNPRDELLFRLTETDDNTLELCITDYFDILSRNNAGTVLERTCIRMNVFIVINTILLTNPFLLMTFTLDVSILIVLYFVSFAQLRNTWSNRLNYH